MSRVWIEFVIGILVGAVVCFGKEFLLQRFLLRGNKFLATLLFWLRLLIDVGVMVLLYQLSIAALVGGALGLSTYTVYLVVKTFKEQ